MCGDKGAGGRATVHLALPLQVPIKVCVQLEENVEAQVISTGVAFETGKKGRPQPGDVFPRMKLIIKSLS